MMRYYIPFLLLMSMACTSPEEKAQQIIDDSLNASGMADFDKVKVEFEFRGREYGLEHNQGRYKMVRLWEDDSLGVIRDEVNNDGFIREIDGKTVEVVDSMAFKYTNSINSVLYFALLPYHLNDAAVNKTYLDEVMIKDKSYHKIKVTFDEEGGGKDHDDVFVYFINTATLFIDYFAYGYITDGDGIRFREAINESIVNGVRLVDYINYQPKDEVDLLNIENEFLNNNLEELSRIELTQLLVEKN